MAAHCRNILGDAVLADSLETHPVCLVVNDKNVFIIISIVTVDGKDIKIW